VDCVDKSNHIDNAVCSTQSPPSVIADFTVIAVVASLSSTMRRMSGSGSRVIFWGLSKDERQQNNPHNAAQIHTEFL
jgi:4-diphosphocytidyl-2C-methyl-D-erythritol kinase